MKQATEKQIQQSIMDYLALSGIFHYRQNSGAFKTEAGGFYKFASKNGLPDIVAIKDGKYVGIECKTKSGKQSEAQAQIEQAIIGAGGIYILARSLDDIINIL